MCYDSVTEFSVHVQELNVIITNVVADAMSWCSIEIIFHTFLKCFMLWRVISAVHFYMNCKIKLWVSQLASKQFECMLCTLTEKNVAIEVAQRMGMKWVLIQFEVFSRHYSKHCTINHVRNSDSMYIVHIQLMQLIFQFNHKTVYHFLQL